MQKPNFSRNDRNSQPPRPYSPPTITVDGGCVYNHRNALALVYGINVPFVSKIAGNQLYDVDGGEFFLWSSPTLVLTCEQAHHAFKQGDEDLNQRLMEAAIDHCNSILPDDCKLPSNAILRLTWVQFGIVSVTYEQSKKNPDQSMDVVRHGANTIILNAPKGNQVEFITTGIPWTPPKRQNTRRN